MDAYINSVACISHHPTFSEDFFFEGVGVIPSSNFLTVSSPAYKDYIPAASLRRASHILKMGISAGRMCLQKERIEHTDAIIIGSAMGCFEDTDKFLLNLSGNNESLLTPTAFIQSTHNTVAGQLALLLKCHGYNFTYVHQNLSFEYALSDALLVLQEDSASRVLVGGVDELIPPLCELFERAGHIKSKEDVLAPLWKSNSKGYVAGEGAAFFSVSKTKGEECSAKLNGLKIIHTLADEDNLLDHYHLFLQESGLKPENISLLLSGINGNAESDAMLNVFTQSLKTPLAYFKHLCGEFFTASSFALWLATNILKKQTVPACIFPEGKALEKIEHIVVVNYSNDGSYSFLCVSKC